VEGCVETDVTSREKRRFFRPDFVSCVPFHTTSPQTPPLSHACSLGETGGENDDGLDLLLGRAIRGLGLDLLQGGDQVVQNRRNVLCNGLVNGVSKGNQGVLDPCQLKRQWEFGQFFERTRKKRGK